MGTKFGLLKCRSVRRKPPGEQWSRRETVEARGTKWNFDIGMDIGIPGQPLESRRDEGMPSATVQQEIPTVPPPAPPPQPDSQVHEMRGERVHAKALRIRAFWSEIGRTPGCETPGPGKSHTRECKAHQDAREESCQTAAAEEAKRGVAEDPDTRPLNPSSSSTDLEPKRTKTTTEADAENAPDQMEVDNFQRTPATAHRLEPASDENVSKKARVARNVLHIRGEGELKLAERRPGDSLKLRRCFDRRALRRQNQGWR